mmetsp:Transcript_18594/g.57960  ORF Transcript_18594/g.57960 Transcript_18594/m.57960 type:complete len:297 (-) Transcript_18594:218-1108(-)
MMPWRQPPACRARPARMRRRPRSSRRSARSTEGTPCSRVEGSRPSCSLGPGGPFSCGVLPVFLSQPHNTRTSPRVQHARSAPRARQWAARSSSKRWRSWRAESLSRIDRSAFIFARAAAPPSGTAIPRSRRRRTASRTLTTLGWRASGSASRSWSSARRTTLVATPVSRSRSRAATASTCAQTWTPMPLTLAPLSSSAGRSSSSPSTATARSSSNRRTANLCVPRAGMLSTWALAGTTLAAISSPTATVPTSGRSSSSRPGPMTSPTPGARSGLRSTARSWASKSSRALLRPRPLA